MVTVIHILALVGATALFMLVAFVVFYLVYGWADGWWSQPKRPRRVYIPGEGRTALLAHPHPSCPALLPPTQDYEATAARLVNTIAGELRRAYWDGQLAEQAKQCHAGTER